MYNQGKLKFNKKLDYKVTYHDPCYLGRYNGETEAPRKLMEAMGIELIEMPRCKENSFCCGAGGGRIWMDDSKLDKRPSELRIEEALERYAFRPNVYAMNQNRSLTKNIGIVGLDAANLTVGLDSRPPAPAASGWPAKIGCSPSCSNNSPPPPP